MPLPLSPAIVAEKNKIASTGAWLVLLELQFPTETPIYLANNTENVSWDGKTWEKFAFEIDDVTEDGRGGLPSFTIRVSNVKRKMEKLVDEYGGALGATATLLVVHSDHTADTEPVFEEPYKIISASIDLQWVTFTLGAENPLRQRSPRQRYLMDSCRFKVFKGTLCGYAGAAAECDRTLKNCQTLGNDDRFGGFPSISIGGGFYA